MSAGIEEWFTARVPKHWNASGLDVAFDQDEILVVVDLAAEPGVLRHFRESTRDEHMAVVMGDVATDEPVLVRVHSECLTGDVFGSMRCDCG